MCIGEIPRTCYIWHYIYYKQNVVWNNRKQQFPRYQGIGDLMSRIYVRRTRLEAGGSPLAQGVKTIRRHLLVPLILEPLCNLNKNYKNS